MLKSGLLMTTAIALAMNLALATTGRAQGDDDDIVYDFPPGTEIYQLTPHSIFSSNLNRPLSDAVTGSGELVLDIPQRRIVFRPLNHFRNLRSWENVTLGFGYRARNHLGDEAVGGGRIIVRGFSATDDQAQTDKHTPISLNVLANDYEAPQRLSIISVGEPDKGVASVSGSQIVFSPNGEFASLGDDDAEAITFPYTIRHQNGLEASANVTVTVRGYIPPPPPPPPPPVGGGFGDPVPGDPSSPQWEWGGGGGDGGGPPGEAHDTTGDGIADHAGPVGAGQTSHGSTDQGVGGMTGGGGGGGGDKIICTAMNATYGFGSFRQKIWLSYSARRAMAENG